MSSFTPFVVRADIKQPVQMAVLGRALYHASTSIGRSVEKLRARQVEQGTLLSKMAHLGSTEGLSRQTLSLLNPSAMTTITSDQGVCALESFDNIVARPNDSRTIGVVNQLVEGLENLKGELKEWVEQSAGNAGTLLEIADRHIDDIAESIADGISKLGDSADDAEARSGVTVNLRPADCLGECMQSLTQAIQKLSHLDTDGLMTDSDKRAAFEAEIAEISDTLKKPTGLTTNEDGTVNPHDEDAVDPEHAPREETLETLGYSAEVVSKLGGMAKDLALALRGLLDEKAVIIENIANGVSAVDQIDENSAQTMDGHREALCNYLCVLSCIVDCSMNDLLTLQSVLETLNS